MVNLTTEKRDELVAQILQSRKYRDLNIPIATVEDLLAQEAEKQSSSRALVKAVRHKLHNIAAPYLGDPGYPKAAHCLEKAFASGSEEEVRLACSRLLGVHASTRERLPVLQEFYDVLFSAIGQPETILDLACGLNPLAFPWMNLPNTVQYWAYDLHQPRVDMLNRYFELQGLQQLARHQDILVAPPQIEADAAFFFKEAHRFEQRQRGCNRAFWQAIKARVLVVTLPAVSLTGKHNLAEKHRNLIYATIGDLPWHVNELCVGTELIFCIDKGYGA
jgi:16S rRNA (guanine(1405)-N(7))-methyltransferase